MNSKDYRNIREAYLDVYRQEELLDENYLWESCLTEEFISEAYQTVADYLVYNEFVPGYNTAEVYMSEMAVDDIDSILFETGVLNEQYLIEAGFFQGLGSGADKLVSGAQKKVQSAVGSAQKAGQTVVGAAQRAGSAVQKAVTPVAQAVQGTAQRAVNTGASALKSGANMVKSGAQAVKGTALRASDAVGKQVQGGIKNVNNATKAVGGALGGATTAVGGAVQRAGSAVQKVGSTIKKNVDNEIKISQQVGSGAPTGGSTKTNPSVSKPASSGSQYTSKNLGGAQYGAFKAGGGDAAMRKGSSAGEVVQQGRKNISKVVSGREMNVTTPGVVKSSFDMFDVVKGYLIGEGYADTEEAALVIMANMSEDWKYSIIEQQMSSVSANAPSGVKKPAVTASISAGGKTPPGQKMLDKAGQMLSGKGPSNNFGRGF